MEEEFVKFKEKLDALLVDASSKAEEIKENFESFKTVFGKEFDVQAQKLDEYKSKLEEKGNRLFKSDDFVTDIKEEVVSVSKDLIKNATKLFTFVKENVSK